MGKQKYTLPALFIVSWLIVLWIFCTDPTKPDFDIPPEIENDSIYTYGIPAVDSSFIMYVYITKGTKPFTFQWLKDETVINNESNDSLVFSSLSKNNSGIYTCIAINDYGSDTSHPYILTVISSEIDTIKPEIKLKSPQDSSVSNDSLLQVDFIITDDNGLSSVTINDCTITSNDSIYTDTIKLSYGKNTVTVIAIDSSPNSNCDTAYATFYYDTIFIDTIAPNITLKSPPDSSITSDSLLRVEFIINDKSGISSVTINDCTVTSNDSIYTDTIKLSYGKNTVTVIAIDSSPNSNSDTAYATFYYDSTYIDTLGPDIDLVSPPDSSFVNDSLVDVKVDINDINDIAWVTINGDTVEPAKGIYIKTVSLNPGINNIKIVAQDKASNQNIDSLILTVIYDNVPPSVKLVNPDIDSSTISSTYKEINVVAKDNYSIAKVVFNVETDSFDVENSDDSIYTSTITGVEHGKFTLVNISAVDMAGNIDNIKVAIKYDSTLVDVDGPNITLKSNIQNNDRVKVATGSIIYQIYDDNGIDSAWFTVNGTFAGVLENIVADEYSCNYNFGINYGENEIEVFATDKSTNNNLSSKKLTLVFDPVITGVITLETPVDSSTDVDKCTTFKWSSTVADPNGDPIKYILYYLYNDVLHFKDADTNTEVTLTFSEALPGNTMVTWKVKAYSVTQPEDSVISENELLFVSYNTPPVVTLSNPSDGDTKLPRRPSFQFSAEDQIDNDNIKDFTLQLGKTQDVTDYEIENITTNNYLLTFDLDCAEQYYWRIIANEETKYQGIDPKSGTSDIHSFYTENYLEWKTIPLFENYRNQTISISLDTLVNWINKAGHSLEFELASVGNGSAVIQGNMLIWERIYNRTGDTTIQVIASDTWTYDPLSVQQGITIHEKTQPSGTERMRFIPAKDSSYYMGSPGGVGNDNEKPQSLVSFTYDYWMDTTEVTQKDFLNVMDEYIGSPDFYVPTTWSFGTGDNYPVYHTYWWIAVIYCNERSEDEALQNVYSWTSNDSLKECVVTINKDNNGYRLPTEAEWEYACRAGTDTKYFWGNDTTNRHDYVYRYHDYNSQVSVVVGVGSEARLPNDFGLYDICGNIREWCWDYFNNYTSDSKTDYFGPSTSSGSGHYEYKVIRSESWGDAPGYHCAVRFNEMSNNMMTGFRIVRKAQ